MEAVRDMYSKFISGEITRDEYISSLPQAEQEALIKKLAEHGIDLKIKTLQPQVQHTDSCCERCEDDHQHTTYPQVNMFNFVAGQQQAYVSGNVHLDNLFAICCNPAMIDQTIIAGNELLALLKDAKTDEEMINNMSNIINQIVSILKNPAASRAVAKALGVEFGFIDPATVSPDDPDLATLKNMSESIAKLFNDGKSTNKNVA